MSMLDQVKKFMEPKSVALFGVSRRTEDGLNILEHLLSYPYGGRLYPVNPNATELFQVKAYSTVSSIQGPVDLALVNLPHHLVPGVIRDCLARGIDSAIIVIQGFADACDEEGRRLHRELEEIVKRGMRILGPNTFGTANPEINFCSSFRK